MMYLTIFDEIFLLTTLLILSSFGYVVLYLKCCPYVGQFISSFTTLDSFVTRYQQNFQFVRCSIGSNMHVTKLIYNKSVVAALLTTTSLLIGYM